MTSASPSDVSLPSRALRRVRLTFDPTPQARAASFITWMWRVVIQSGGRGRGRGREGEGQTGHRVRVDVCFVMLGGGGGSDVRGPCGVV